MQIKTHGTWTLAVLAVLAMGTQLGGCGSSDDEEGTPPMEETGGTPGATGGTTGGDAGSASTTGGTTGNTGGTTGDAGSPSTSDYDAELPFAVDGIYVPSGHMGDYLDITTTPGPDDDDPTCGGDRPDGDPTGACHWFAYAAEGLEGWAGVYWQNPDQNWGELPGTSVEPGATQVRFYAKGGAGGEIITILVGGLAGESSPGVPYDYQDTLTIEEVLTLTAEWTEYTIDLSGETYDEVLGGFGWTAAAADNAGPIEFYIDDIEWI